MKKISKKIIVLFLLVAIGIGATALPVSATNTLILTSTADSAQPGKSLTVTVGFSLDAGVSAGQIEVTYNSKVLWFSKNASTKTEDVTDTLTVDETNSKITIIFAPVDSTVKQVTQKLVFAVTTNSAPGDKGDITVKVTRASDGNFTELTPSQALGSDTATKTITAAGVPTPTATPTPTSTPTPTKAPTQTVTPTKTPAQSQVPSATPTQTQEPTGTEEIDPSGTPGEIEGTPGDETADPSATPEIDSTVTPMITQKPTAVPTATDNQALLIKSGALGFWMIVVLVVGIWIGIAIGFFIWGRRKGRNRIRRSKIIGNDEF